MDMTFFDVQIRAKSLILPHLLGYGSSVPAEYLITPRSENATLICDHSLSYRQNCCIRSDHNDTPKMEVSVALGVQIRREDHTNLCLERRRWVRA